MPALHPSASRRLFFLRRLGAALALGSTVVPALAQDPSPPATANPGAREAMWYAPTAADWQKPVLIQWQRSWDDAVLLAQQTNQPILVCVNMDGEIASEHYAGVRYRSAEIAKLYEPYICVIASVYRHTPRDHDEQGHRIPCPRFGTVTCGEHIAIEPIVYEKFMDGRRIAPRHIMVEPDGRETYDVYLAFDTDSVFGAIRNGIAERKVATTPLVRGDRSLQERVQSVDSKDRDDVERAFRDGDAALKRVLLDKALQLGEKAPLELLRQASHGFDPQLGQRARDGLAAARSPGAAALIGEVLQAPIDAGQRQALLAALDALAAHDAEARTLAITHRGLAARSTAIDVDGWQLGLVGASYQPAVAPDPRERLQALDAAAKARPEDPMVHIEQAEASLADAQLPGQDLKMRTLLLTDALRAADRAAGLGAPAWRVDVVRALGQKALGDDAAAYQLAERAVPAMPTELHDANSAAVLFLFAEARQEAIAKAWREKREWPRQWLTDVHAAYAVLARHPFGTDVQVAHHYDFLGFFGGVVAANQALDQGLERFPESPLLHQRLRQRILKEQGVEALETAYAALLQQQPQSATMHWFAGYAALVSAEQHRRRGLAEAARDDYGRGIERFERALQLDPAQQASCDHYVAMALGGRARLWFECNDLDRAVADLVASFERSPRTAPVLDGMQLSASETARMLVAKTREVQRQDLLQKLQAAMDALDKELLQLPEFERIGPAPGQRQGPRRRGR